MRILRFKLKNGENKDCELAGFSALPKNFKQSMSLIETKDNKFWLTISESLIEDFKQVDNIEVIRK